MTTAKTWNNTSFSIPDNGDPRGTWGINLSTFLKALADNALSKYGGSFQLTGADIDFGATYATKQAYLKSRTTNIGTTGFVLMANNEGLGWRNAANGGDIVLKAGSDDRLKYGAAGAEVNVPTVSSTDTLTNKTLTAPTITSPTGLVKADVGLGNVDNTADTAKPVSTAQQTALDLKAPIASPTFTGTVAGITASMVGLGNVDNTSDATKNAASVTLTNKTITDAIIDDGVRLNHETTVTTPASGKVSLFAKNDDKLYLTNSSGVTSPVSASGTGEKNYVSNPSAASSTTGWSNVGDLDIARTTTASELPREYTTATGFKITADANTQSVADYVYFDFTLDDVDLNKKLKIEWSQKLFGAYTAGQLAVVITTQADRTTALHTPITTAIPASDGVFTTSFDSSTTATLSLVIRATGDMTTDTGIVISDVVVGPGTITQGAAVSEWVSYTPTLNVGAFGTSTMAVNYRRVGSAMEMLFEVVQTGAGTAGSGAYTFNMPTGLTIDTAKLLGTNIIGKGYITSGATEYANSLAYASSTTRFGFYINPTATSVGAVGSANTPLSTANFQISMLLQIPIAEWAGNGTVNLGPGAQQEFCSVTSTWDAADTTATALSRSPGGTLMGGTLSLSRTKRVQFQYPIQADDLISLEFSSDGSAWTAAAYSRLNGFLVVPSTNSADTANSGVWYERVSGSTTQIDVIFGRYMSMANDDSPVTDWPSANAYWRVRKAKASSPVGFGLATATESGLVKSSRFQKKRLSANVTGNTSGNGNTATDLTFNGLTIGNIYRVSGQVAMYQTTNNSGAVTNIVHNSAVIGSLRGNLNMAEFSGEEMIVATGVNTIFTAAATTLTFAIFASGASLLGNNSDAQSYIILEELGGYAVTTAFT